MLTWEGDDLDCKLKEVHLHLGHVLDTNWFTEYLTVLYIREYQPAIEAWVEKQLFCDMTPRQRKNYTKAKQMFPAFTIE